jgi:hypothetical protein
VRLSNFWLRIRLGTELCVRVQFFTVESSSAVLKFLGGGVFPGSAYDSRPGGPAAGEVLKRLKARVWGDFETAMGAHLQANGLERPCRIPEAGAGGRGSEAKYSHEEALRREETAVVGKLGILFLSYRVQYWYWEILEMFRRSVALPPSLSKCGLIWLNTNRSQGRGCS